MTEPTWYRTYFDEAYLRRYLAFLTPERTEREVDGLIDLLALEPGARILDLACGHGRHAILLARRGYDVTGFDLSGIALARAREDAAAADVALRLVQGDMRELSFDAEFDVVLNLFTAFGYFEHEAEDARVLDGVARALLPGGRFLLETLHTAGLLRRFTPSHVERYHDGLVVVHEHAYDAVTGVLHDRVTSFDVDGSRREQGTTVRLYTVPELGRMLDAAGLAFERACGGFSGDDLTLESFRLALVARKPGQG